MRLLHIGMFNRHETQITMREALESISSIYSEYSFEENLLQAQSAFNSADEYDVIFLHVQRPGVIDIKKAKELNEKGVHIFNFTGDVRQPLPEWYLALAPYVTTLFTNMYDVNYVRSFGHRAEYLQVGYNHYVYKKDGLKDKTAPQIVFMGNNYGKTFPLSQDRINLVGRLKRKYGNNFKVYGSGWERGTENLNHRQDREAEIYRGAKIAINFSHFNLSRYSSDRLFRILGCGTFCLTHRYKDMNLEFEDGKHLCAFDNINDLCAKIDYYLRNEHERREIAKNGNELCESTCTWGHRISQLKNMIDERVLCSSISQ